MYGQNIGLFEIDLYDNGTTNTRSTKMFELKGKIIHFIITIKARNLDHFDFSFSK